MLMLAFNSGLVLEACSISINFILAFALLHVVVDHFVPTIFHSALLGSVQIACQL